MKFFDYYDIKNQSRRLQDINKRIMRYVDRDRYEKVFETQYDLCLRILGTNRYYWYNEFYPNEHKEICYRGIRLCYRYRWAFPDIWSYSRLLYIKLAREINILRYVEDISVTDDMNRKLAADNPEIKYELLRMSGLGDRSSVEIQKIDELSRIHYIRYDKLLDYVMSKYCMYKKDTDEYKNLLVSMMISIYSGEIRYYKIDYRLRNSLIYLINQYNRLVGKMDEHGVITIATD